MENILDLKITINKNIDKLSLKKKHNLNADLPVVTSISENVKEFRSDGIDYIGFD